MTLTLTLADHDKRCNDLFRKLDALRSAGQGGQHASAEYLETLKQLQQATRERLASAGMVEVSL